jgi:integrase
MPAAGATWALPIHGMPGRKIQQRRLVRKAHIKFEALAPATLRRYKIAVNRFFVWRKSAGYSLPKTLERLDFLSGEFVNFLYQDERPLGWAGDFLSGIKRLFPRCRRHLETTGLYYKNWVKAVHRVRAFPFSPELARGVAAMALLDKQPLFAAAVLLCFVGLLRVGEVTQLKAGQIKCLSNSVALISLPDSKGAQRKGSSESVLIREALLVQVLKHLKSNTSDADLIFSQSYRSFAASLIYYVKCFGLSHPNLTPHGLRRGGATWHFCKFQSYDKTQEHGRWAQARTARIYIDEAMTEHGFALLPSDGQNKLVRANSLLSSLLKQTFPE